MTNTKKIFYILSVVMAVCSAIIFTIYLATNSNKETAFVPVTETTYSETIAPVIEKETEYFYFETNETDVIKDIRIIPIGD